MTEPRTALVTGASSGVGKAAAIALARQGWTVIAHGRDAARSAAALADISAEATGAVHMVQADLALLSDVSRMADEVAALTPKVDVLLNNAGGMRTEMIITPEGNDVSFAGNHLGHFLLTKRLMPQLLAAGRPRVVNTSSDGHYYCKSIDWDDLQLTRNWVSGNSYCWVKLCNVMFARELARRYGGDGLIAHAFHPGVVDSNFVSHVIESTRAYMATLDASPPDVAAAPLVWLATSDEAGTQNGLYWNKGVAESPNDIALDDAACAQLWDESEKLLAKSGY
jgi:NAD(P)-dependent dehydrogenase (short-subunit alcohol dehydrogenase family)